jgi:hypothetical protein
MMKNSTILESLILEQRLNQCSKSPEIARGSLNNASERRAAIQNFEASERATSMLAAHSPFYCISYTVKNTVKQGGCWVDTSKEDHE